MGWSLEEDIRGRVWCPERGRRERSAVLSTVATFKKLVLFKDL